MTGVAESRSCPAARCRRDAGALSPLDGTADPNRVGGAARPSGAGPGERPRVWAGAAAGRTAGRPGRGPGPGRLPVPRHRRGSCRASGAPAAPRRWSRAADRARRPRCRPRRRRSGAPGVPPDRRGAGRGPTRRSATSRSRARCHPARRPTDPCGTRPCGRRRCPARVSGAPRSMRVANSRPGVLDQLAEQRVADQRCASGRRTDRHRSAGVGGAGGAPAGVPASVAVARRQPPRLLSARPALTPDAPRCSGGVQGGGGMVEPALVGFRPRAAPRRPAPVDPGRGATARSRGCRAPEVGGSDQPCSAAASAASRRARRPAPVAPLQFPARARARAVRSAGVDSGSDAGRGRVGRGPTWPGSPAPVPRPATSAAAGPSAQPASGPSPAGLERRVGQGARTRDGGRRRARSGARPTWPRPRPGGCAAAPHGRGRTVPRPSRPAPLSGRHPTGLPPRAARRAWTGRRTRVRGRRRRRRPGPQVPARPERCRRSRSRPRRGRPRGAARRADGSGAWRSGAGSPRAGRRCGPRPAARRRPVRRSTRR